jgi:sugar lactone lactonase YvrE
MAVTYSWVKHNNGSFAIENENIPFVDFATDATESDLINKYQYQLAYERYLGSSGVGTSNFVDYLHRPYGLAVYTYSSNIKIYFITDEADNCIKAFIDSGLTISGINNSVGNAAGEFYRPRGIAYADNYLWVVDGGNNRVQKFTVGTLSGSRISLTHVASIGTTGAGQLYDPGYIAVDTANDRLHITSLDSGANKIKVYNYTGTYVRTYGSGSGTTTQNLFNPMGLAISSSRGIYVASQDDSKIKNYNLTTGAYIGEVAALSAYDPIVKPMGIEIYESSSFGLNFFITDQLNRVIMLNSSFSQSAIFGSPGVGNYKFIEPKALKVDNNQLCVLDTGNDKLKLFNLNLDVEAVQYEDLIGSGLYNPVSFDFGKDIYNTNGYYVIDGSIGVLAFVPHLSVTTPTIQKFETPGNPTNAYLSPTNFIAVVTKEYTVPSPGAYVYCFTTDGNYCQFQTTIATFNDEFDDLGGSSYSYYKALPTGSAASTLNTTATIKKKIINKYYGGANEIWVMTGNDSIMTFDLSSELVGFSIGVSDLVDIDADPVDATGSVAALINSAGTYSINLYNTFGNLLKSFTFTSPSGGYPDIPEDGGINLNILYRSTTNEFVLYNKYFMHVYRATNSGTPTVLYPYGSFLFNRISQTRLDISTSPIRDNFGYDLIRRSTGYFGQDLIYGINSNGYLSHIKYGGNINNIFSGYIKSASYTYKKMVYGAQMFLVIANDGTSDKLYRINKGTRTSDLTLVNGSWTNIDICAGPTISSGVTQTCKFYVMKSDGTVVLYIATTNTSTNTTTFTLSLQYQNFAGGETATQIVHSHANALFILAGTSSPKEIFALNPDTLIKLYKVTDLALSPVTAHNICYVPKKEQRVTGGTYTQVLDSTPNLIVYTSSSTVKLLKFFTSGLVGTDQKYTVRTLTSSSPNPRPTQISVKNDILICDNFEKWFKLDMTSGSETASIVSHSAYKFPYSYLNYADMTSYNPIVYVDLFDPYYFRGPIYAAFSGLPAAATYKELVETYYIPGTQIASTLQSDTSSLAYAFNRPVATTINSVDNCVYFIDQKNYKIKKYDPSVSDKASAYSVFSDTSYLLMNSITSDSSSNIYVTYTYSDFGTDYAGIAKFNSSGSRTSSLTSAGSGTSQFTNPQGIVWKSGNLYIVDKDLHKVKKFTDALSYTSQFGSQGSGNNQFDSPTGIEYIDRYDNLYVVDTGNSRIKEITNSLSFEAHYGASGSDPEDLSVPIDIAVDNSGDGTIYITNNGTNKKINVFTNLFDYVTSISSDNTDMFEPYGVAVGTDSLFVADLNNRLLTINKFASYDSSKGLSVLTSSFNSVDNPTGIYIDSNNDDRHYIADKNNNRISTYTYDGTLIAHYGSFGIGNTSFDAPTSIVLNTASTRAWVLDSGNSRLVMHSLPFGSSSFLDSDTATESCTSVAIGNSNIYAVDNLNDNVRIYTYTSSTVSYSTTFGGTGSTNGYFNSPYGVAVKSTGDILVTDTLNNRVSVFDSSNTWQSNFGSSELDGPLGVHIDESDRVYVSDATSVKVYNTNYEFVEELNSTANLYASGSFNYPVSLSTFIRGNDKFLSVAEQFNDRINQKKYTYDKVLTFDASNFENATISGVYSDGTYVYIADKANDKVQRTNTSGVLDSEFGTSGSGTGELRAPAGISMDSANQIYVVDSGNNRIQVFSESSGTYTNVTSIGSSGSGNVQFFTPLDISIDTSDYLYIADNANGRVQILDDTYAYVNEIDLEYNPESVAIDEINGHIVICGEDKISIYDLITYSEITTITSNSSGGNNPNCISVRIDQNNDYLVADSVSGYIWKYSKDLVFLYGLDLLTSDSLRTLGTDGSYIYVGQINLGSLYENQVYSVKFHGSEVASCKIFLNSAYCTVINAAGQIIDNEPMSNYFKIIACTFTSDNSSIFDNPSSWTDITDGTNFVQIASSGTLLNSKFDSYTDLLGIAIVPNNADSIKDLQVRNIQLIAEFQTKMPDTSGFITPRPY